MANLRSCFLIGLAASTAALVTLAACDSDERIEFVSPPDDAGLDVVARLPDAPSPVDSATDAAPPPRSDVDAANEPVVCDAAPCAVELAAGSGHFCARLSDGTVRCWGDDTEGALGRGEPVDAGDSGDAGAPADPGAPREVVGLTGIVQISAGGGTTCARDGAGTLRCWGSNESGQLGRSPDAGTADSDRHATPAPIAMPGPFANVDVARRSVCAVTPAGGAACWGANTERQLARPYSGNFGAPASVDFAGKVVTRTAGTSYTAFALTADGGLLSWGALSGGFASSGRESSISVDPSPAPIPTLEGVTSVAGGEIHACAIENGAVSCWGRSERAALCTGLTRPEVLPAPASIGSPPYAQRLAASKNNTCVRMTDGTLRCCGSDETGQIGTGKVGFTSPSFTKSIAFTGYAVQVALSDTSTCALLRGGTVECWGSNDHGQLGRGDHGDKPLPVPARVAF